eukprot:scaffold379002_cov51-Attheya_sp.AAC.1
MTSLASGLPPPSQPGLLLSNNPLAGETSSPAPSCRSVLDNVVPRKRYEVRWPSPMQNHTFMRDQSLSHQGP